MCGVFCSRIEAFFWFFYRFRGDEWLALLVISDRSAVVKQGEKKGEMSRNLHQKGVYTAAKVVLKIVERPN